MSDVMHVPTRASGFTRGAVTDANERIRQLDADRTVLTTIAIAPREKLVRKDARANCVFCEKKFRTFSRRFNCRACGDVVCRSCFRTRDVQVGPHVRDALPVRVCLDCIDRALTIAPADSVSSVLSNSSAHASSGHVVEMSACSSHMKFADGLVGDAAPTSSRSITQLDELSAYSDDDDEGDADYDTDGGSEDEDDSRTRRHSTKQVVPSRSKRGESNLTSSTTSSSGSRVLELVPEDANVTDFAEEFERALEDADDERRARLLQQYNVTCASRQREFDAICELLCGALHSGVAGVAFMTKTSQWYKAKIGISQSELPREVAFCSQVMGDGTDPTFVLDASQDPRFWSNPLVTGSARIRFYASMPIRDPVTKLVLGSVFVMDPSPKQRVPSRAVEVLAYVSSAVEKLLVLSLHEQRRHASRVSESAADLMASEFGHISKRSLSARSTQDRPGVKLLDSEELLTSLRHSTGRAAFDFEKEPRTPIVHQANVTKSAPGRCQDVLVQIETTQQLLSSLRRSQTEKVRTSGGEVEV